MVFLNPEFHCCFFCVLHEKTYLEGSSENEILFSAWLPALDRCILSSVMLSTIILKRTSV